MINVQCPTCDGLSNRLYLEVSDYITGGEICHCSVSKVQNGISKPRTRAGAYGSILFQ
jgi:hypothetical protein